MIRSFQTFSILLFACMSSLSAVAEAEIKLHDTNFYLFSKQSEVFYPYTANVSLLMKPECSASQVNDTISRLAAGGINSIRVVIDEAFSVDSRLDHYEQFDGQLNPIILERLDLILRAAEQNDLYVIVCLFDLQRIAIHWDQHPHNKKNGGSCEKLSEFLTHSQMLSRSLQRVKQIVTEFQGRNILAWEIARGANIWSHFEGLNYRPVSEYMKAVQFWLLRLLNEVKQKDEQNHLTAIGCAPNSLPDQLNQLPFDIHFLHIYSTKEPEQIAKSVPPMIQIARKYKKPVFVSELTWKVDESEWEPMNHAGFWSALASNSAAFLTVHNRSGLIDLRPSEYNLLESAQVFLYNVNLEGRPRPPLEVPAEIYSEDSFIVAQSMVGNDWLFWILRNDSGDSKARMVFYSIEGMYEYFWMDLEESVRGELKEFKSQKIQIQLQSPNFERSIIGRMRMLEAFRQKKDNPQSENSMKNGE